jgi:hypothetical protein
MEIVAYQIENGICRFIHKTQHGYQVVSAEDHHGLKDFLFKFGGKKLEEGCNIYDHSLLLRFRHQ